MKHCKIYLKDVLSDNINKKAVIYHNTAKAVNTMKDDIDTWLNLTDTFLGDVVAITGGMSSEIKFEATSSFTKDVNAQNLLDYDLFYARVLCCVDRCINAGLDSSSVHAVLRYGISKSLLDTMQECGRAG